MMIGGFSNIYCTIVLKVLDGHSTCILLLLECTHQYPCLYYPVVIARYLTNKSGEIDYEL